MQERIYCHDLDAGGKKWYLPAGGEWQPLYRNSSAVNTINNQLSAIQASRLTSAPNTIPLNDTNDWYWASNECRQNTDCYGAIVIGIGTPYSTCSTQHGEFSDGTPATRCIFKY
ncbi:MAG: hypothetical protein IJ660_01750 [Alphaproteobacteria bacterium]|nr:hypothetical protein [Alphaproteobacteria bacterium]